MPLKKSQMRSLFIFVLVILPSLTYAQGYKQKQFDKMLNGLIQHSVSEMEAKNVEFDPSIIYLDAREINEYNTSKITNAQWVGYNDFDISRVENLDKNQQIIVYCSIGYRSEKVTEKLKDAGFTNVTNMLGGIFEWVNYKKTVVDSSNIETHSVHGFDKEWGKWLNGDLVEKVYN